MKRYVVWPAAALLLGGVARWAPAQQTGAQQQAAECDLKTSHSTVSRAVLYIQNALNTQDTTKKQQALDGAQRSLLEALDQGQAENPAVWHYLGIYHALQLDKDIAGLAQADSASDAGKSDSLRAVLMHEVEAADTSFDKVETMMPGCQKEDEQFRYMAWAKVANQGIAAMRQNDYDKAKQYFNTANKVYDKDPTTYFYSATLFASDNNADSALTYFKHAAEVADGDTSYTEIHEKSVQNVARIYQVLEQWDSAATWFRTYRSVVPGDYSALVELESAHLSAAQASTDAGDSTKAKAYVARAAPLHDSIMSKADSLNPSDLFRSGVNEFRGDFPGEAAETFEAGLKQDPYYRNGLFNLTNAYFQLAQEKSDSAKFYAAKMLPVAQRLVAVDPLSRQVLRLVAAAYQFLGRDDSTDAVLKRVNAMTYEIDVQSARATNGGYDVQGTITALLPPGAQALRDSIRTDSTRLETVKHTTVPAAQRAQLQRREATLQRNLDRYHTNLQKAMATVSIPTLTFEFLGNDGHVVTTQTVAAQAIAPNDSRQFDLTATGDGIVAYRYKPGA